MKTAAIRRAQDRIEVHLDHGERQALLTIVERLHKSDAEFPAPAGYDDPTLNDEYQRLVIPDITQAYAKDLEMVREGLHQQGPSCTLNEPQAMAWIRAINILRLQAGKLLNIKIDGWEEQINSTQQESPEYHMLIALGWIQQGIIDALEER